MGFFDRWKKAPKPSEDSTPAPQPTTPSKPPGVTQSVSHGVRPVTDDEIFEAVKTHRFDQAVRLLSESGKINLCDAKGISVLQHAVVMDGHTVVRFLVSNGADPNIGPSHSPTALHNASSDRAIAKLLIDRGARVDARDNKGQTPLMWAAGNNKADVVALLLESGADPTVADGQSTTGRHHAAFRGAVDSARLLISRGASVEACHLTLPKPFYRSPTASIPNDGTSYQGWIGRQRQE